MDIDAFDNDFWKLKNTSVSENKLSRNLVQEYNKSRKISGSGLLCHAPNVSLNFEQTGNANACCYNRTFVLGKYPEQSVNDIWFGSKAEELRDHMRKNDLSHGCQICHKQLESRNFLGVHARHFDDYKASRKSFIQKLTGKSTMDMPQCMEFELENTCNLECTMCNGYFSSSIRKNREKLPPTVSPYNDEFVEQLVPFLPHLKDAKFLGGEPFLIPIYYQIWEKIAEHNPKMLVHITTNGTIYNNRVRDLLDRMRCGIVMSIDSIVEETYNKIRINASYDRVMENIGKFRDYTRKKNVWFSYAVCPMTLNWKEMPDLVRHCTQRDTYIFFNTVFQPFDLCLRSFNVDQLQDVIDFYSSQEISNSGTIARHNAKAFSDLTNQIIEWKKDKIEFYNRENKIKEDYNSAVENVLNLSTEQQLSNSKFVEIVKALIKSDSKPRNYDDRTVFESDPNFVDPEEFQQIQTEVENYNDLVNELNFMVIDLIFDNLGSGAKTFTEALIVYKEFLNGRSKSDKFERKVELILTWLENNPGRKEEVKTMVSGSASNLIDYIDSAPMVLIKEALRRMETKVS